MAAKRLIRICYYVNQELSSAISLPLYVQLGKECYLPLDIRQTKRYAIVLRMVEVMTFNVSQRSYVTLL